MAYYPAHTLSNCPRLFPSCCVLKLIILFILWERSDLVCLLTTISSTLEILILLFILTYQFKWFWPSAVESFPFSASAGEITLSLWLVTDESFLM